LGGSKLSPAECPKPVACAEKRSVWIALIVLGLVLNIQLVHATTESYTLESAHPYSNNYDKTWTITKSEATKIRVHFTKIETESGWDYVYIYDSLDTELAKYDGTHTDKWSPWATGSKIKVRLTSDKSITKWGFKIDKIEYEVAAQDSWDPTDDSASIGTALTPTTTTQQHGAHSLSSSDNYDWFRISMTAGRKYYFYGSWDSYSDTYAELYSDSGGSNRVAYDDDSGGNGQFSFSYTAANTQTYYLRIRSYSVGSDSNYYLNYYYIQPQNDANSGGDAGNTFDAALLISPSSYTGYIDSTDTEDWYKFSVSEGMRIDITMTPPSNADFDLKLYDANGNLKASSTRGTGLTDTISYVANTSGILYWRMKVYQWSGSGTYSFTLAVTQNDAGSGGDAGNDFYSALLISPGSYKGYIDSSDTQDWYKFSVTQGQKIYVAMTPPSGVDFDLELYDQNNNLRASSTRVAGYADSITYIADSSGTWYWRFRIYQYSGIGTYSFSLNVFTPPNPLISIITPTEVGPSETFAVTISVTNNGGDGYFTGGAHLHIDAGEVVSVDKGSFDSYDSSASWSEVYKHKVEFYTSSGEVTFPSGATKSGTVYIRAPSSGAITLYYRSWLRDYERYIYRTPDDPEKPDGTETESTKNFLLYATFTKIVNVKAAGMLSITTTPVSGAIYVDGSYKAAGSWSGSVDVGYYTISFGEVPGYITPQPQVVYVSEGETEYVTGIYVLKVYGVSLSPPSQSKTITTEEQAVYTFTIANTGNTKDTFSISTTRGTLSKTSVTLKAEESTTFTLTDSSSTPGTFTAEITATSQGDTTKEATATATTIVALANQPPTANFTVTPTSGDTTTNFNLDASSSTDDKDPVTSLQVRWDWEDDGAYDTGWTTTKTASQQYTIAGTYTIKLEVKDTGGLTSTATKSVMVSEPPRVTRPYSEPEAQGGFFVPNKGEQWMPNSYTAFYSFKYTDDEVYKFKERHKVEIEWILPDYQFEYILRSYETNFIDAEVADALGPFDPGSNEFDISEKKPYMWERGTEYYAIISVFPPLILPDKVDMEIELNRYEACFLGLGLILGCPKAGDTVKNVPIGDKINWARADRNITGYGYDFWPRSPIPPEEEEDVLENLIEDRNFISVDSLSVHEMKNIAQQYALSVRGFELYSASTWITIGVFLQEGETIDDGLQIIRNELGREPNDYQIFSIQVQEIPPDIITHPKVLGVDTRIHPNDEKWKAALPSVSVNPELISIEPGRTAVYNITVYNTGSSQDAYDSSVIMINETWYNLSQTSVTVDPRSSKTVTLSITPPRDSSIQPDLYIFAVSAQSKTNPELLNTGGATLQILPYYEVSAEISPVFAEVEPGNAINYTLQVKNKGNVNDTITLTLEAPEWVSTEITSVSLNASETATALLRIVPPRNYTIAAMNYSFNVTATSVSNSSVSAKTFATVRVLPFYEVKTAISPAYLEVEPTSIAAYNITIQNLGNAEDTYDLAVTDIEPAWIPIHVPTSLLPGASANVTLDIIPPSCTLPQMIEFRVIARSLTDSTIRDSANATLNIIDKTPPEISISSPLAPNYSYTEDIILNFTATDNGSCIFSIAADLDGVSVSSGQVIDLFNLSLGGHLLMVVVADNAGNNATASVVFAVIDDVPPVVTVAEPTAQNYSYTKNITLNFTVYDEKSGVASFKAHLDDTEVASGQVIDLFNFTLGEHNLTIEASDNAGNDATKTVSFTVIDDVPPVSSDNADKEWYNSDITIMITARDEKSSVKEIRYAVNEGQEVTVAGSTANATITYEHDNNTIKYYAVDEWGNAEAPKLVDGIKLDKTPPVVRLWLDPAKEFYFSDELLPVNYEAYDPKVQGSPSNNITLTFDIDGTAVEDPTNIADWIGTHTLTLTAVDKAGNKASASLNFTATLRAEINIDPDTLNLKSEGKWITGYIEFPSRYDVMSIDISTVTLNRTINAENDPKYDFVSSPVPADKDGDGLVEFMVKFDRSAVEQILEPADAVTLSVSGEFTAGIFEGRDTIRVIEEGSNKSVNSTVLKLNKHVEKKGGRDNQARVRIDLFTVGNTVVDSVFVREYIPEELGRDTSNGAFTGYGLMWDVGRIKQGEKQSIEYTLIIPEVKVPTTYTLRTVVEYQTAEDLETIEEITYLVVEPDGQVKLKAGQGKHAVKERGQGYTRGTRGRHYDRGGGSGEDRGRGRGRPENPGRPEDPGRGPPDNPRQPDNPDNPPPNNPNPGQPKNPGQGNDNGGGNPSQGNGNGGGNDSPNPGQGNGGSNSSDGGENSGGNGQGGDNLGRGNDNSDDKGGGKK